MDTAVSYPRQEETVVPRPEGERWLLLAHQIPPTPAYTRVRIRRRLARIGAALLKNSVYALPSRDDTREDFEWLRKEVLEAGGEAFLCEAVFIDDRTNDRLRAAFEDERGTAYAEIGAEAASLAARVRAAGDPEERRKAAADLAAIERRLADVAAIDFFCADEGARARRTVAELAEAIHTRTEERMANERETAGRTWVTRRGVRVDRMASAWLIGRFIDPRPRFKFVDPQGYRPDEGELRFDMFDGEFTHEADRCTFETLVHRFDLARDPALAAIAEIVHDLDLKEERFARPETAGVASMLSGVALRHEEDLERIASGREIFDALYASFGAR